MAEVDLWPITVEGEDLAVSAEGMHPHVTANVELVSGLLLQRQVLQTTAVVGGGGAATGKTAG